MTAAEAQMAWLTIVVMAGFGRICYLLENLLSHKTGETSPRERQ